jgi:hypothetical protein
LEKQNYSEDQNLKGFVIHSKPCIEKILNFIVDFNNNFLIQFIALDFIKIQKNKIKNKKKSYLP